MGIYRVCISLRVFLKQYNLRFHVYIMTISQITTTLKSVLILLLILNVYFVLL